MVKIERTYPRYCCHSCGRQDNEILPVWEIKVGIPSSDGSVQIILYHYVKTAWRHYKRK